MPQLPRRTAPPSRPELHQDRQVFVDLALRFQLELRNLAALSRAMRHIEEVRDPFGGRAKAL